MTLRSREAWFDMLGTACAVALLREMVLIAFYGEYRLIEPNRLILWVEILVLAGVVVLGVERYIHDIRERKVWQKRRCPRRRMSREPKT